MATFHLDSEASIRLTAEQAHFFLVKPLETSPQSSFFQHILNICEENRALGPGSSCSVVLYSVALLTAHEGAYEDLDLFLASGLRELKTEMGGWRQGRSVGCPRNCYQFRIQIRLQAEGRSD